MNLSRPSRVVAVIVTIFSLLFTQLALASYDCPQLNAAPPSAMAADMVDCANMATMDADEPGLCHAHCDARKQTLDTPQVPLVAPFVAAALLLVVTDSAVLTRSYGLQRSAALLTRSNAPPLAIRNCCFRI